MLLTTVLLIVLVRFARRRRVAGSSIALFTLWYATSRVFTDFLRTDPRPLLGLTGSQLTSLALIALVLVALRVRRGRPEVGRGDLTPAARPVTGDEPSHQPSASVG